jgi:hypothetical protein
VTVLVPPGPSREIHVVMDTATPLLFPAGLLHLSLRATDDVGRVSTPFVVELTMISAQRPTLVLRCETPPSGATTTGLSLPPDGGGNPLLGERRAFALTVAGIPNPTTGAAFTRLLGPNGIDPARLVVPLRPRLTWRRRIAAGNLSRRRPGRRLVVGPSPAAS